MATSSLPSTTQLRYRGRTYEVLRGEDGVVRVLRTTRSGKVEVKGPVAFAVAKRATKGRARRPPNRSKTLRGAARKKLERKKK